MKIKIKFSKVEIEAELYDNSTARELAKNLPIKGRVNTWGDEIYFDVDFHVPLDSSAKEMVDAGDLGFWPTGNCFCVFFGPTPGSRPGEIRPASAVNVFGKVIGNLGVLKSVREGEEVIVTKA